MHVSFVHALVSTTYGLNDSNFNSPIQYDIGDLWLGENFDSYMENTMENIFDMIEDDLLSVWSTNKSEQES